MRWKNQMLTAAGLMLVSSNLQAVPAAELKENYQSIIERNSFGLKPPPPPATNNIAPPEAKPKVEVFLTGVTSIGYPKYPKQAYFYTREQGKKEITYYALTEGAGKDGIEVLQIDPEQRKVRIKMDNAETMLSFATHGVPVTATASRPNVPGLPGAQPLPMPGQSRMGRGARSSQNGSAPSPTVTYDSNGQPIYNSGAAPQPLNSTMNQESTGLRQIPSRRIRGGGNRYGNSGAPVPGGPGGIGEGGPQAQQQEVRDPAEEYVRAHLNRAARERELNIPMPPLPTVQ